MGLIYLSLTVFFAVLYYVLKKRFALWATIYFALWTFIVVVLGKQYY